MIERLRQILHYDPETGVFTWRVRPAQCMKVGDVAGGLTSEGYRQIRIDGKRHQAHRLAWLYVHGVMPPHDIDHINGVHDDNRISNLRPATRTENCHNLHRLRITNTSGTTGVYWHKRIQKWQAAIKFNGKDKHLGYFETKEDAKEFRDLAEAMAHPFSVKDSPCHT